MKIDQLVKKVIEFKNVEVQLRTTNKLQQHPVGLLMPVFVHDKD